MLMHDPDTIIFELADMKFYNIEAVKDSLYIDSLRYLNEKRRLQKEKKAK